MGRISRRKKGRSLDPNVSWEARGMNNAKEKKADDGFGERKAGALYPIKVFILTYLPNMKRGKLTCMYKYPVAKRRMNDRPIHSTTCLLHHERERELESPLR